MSHQTPTILLLALLVGCSADPSGVLLDVDSTKRLPVETPAASVGSEPRVRTNDVGMEFALVPAGRFEMGARDTDRFAPYSRCEGPVRDVEITRPFWMGRHEVTVGEFRTFVRATGYRTRAEIDGDGCNGVDLGTGALIRRIDWIWSSPPFEQTDDHPVVCVAWEDAVAFCMWLSEVEGRTCRLPTEAEWEYACRAGSDTLFASGDRVEDLRRFGNAGDAALLRAFPVAEGTAPWDDGHAFTAPVASFQPNEFGLYDMHGNVGEWCQDWYDPLAYWSLERRDPTGPAEPTTWRVVRGGSWYNTPTSCRSTGRHDGIETARSITNGFRVVVEVGRSTD